MAVRAADAAGRPAYDNSKLELPVQALYVAWDFQRVGRADDRRGEFEAHVRRALQALFDHFLA
jgi:hypothetical protein